MHILVFEHIVFSTWARPGHGLAARSSTSNRVNSKLFKYQKTAVELCYIVYCTIWWRRYSIVAWACYIVCYRTTKLLLARVWLCECEDREDLFDFIEFYWLSAGWAPVRVENENRMSIEVTILFFWTPIHVQVSTVHCTRLPPIIIYIYNLSIYVYIYIYMPILHPTDPGTQGEAFRATGMREGRKTKYGHARQQVCVCVIVWGVSVLCVLWFCSQQTETYVYCVMLRCCRVFVWDLWPVSLLIMSDK